MDTLLLTTRGRRSGKLRRTALIYGRDGDAYLLVADRMREDIDAVESQVFAKQVHGRIARIWRKVKVDGHAAEVLAAAKRLKTDG